MVIICLTLFLLNHLNFAVAIKCYMSQSSLPILKPQLGTFFAAENQKECGEGVTQCQRYIAKNGDKGYAFHCGLGQDKKMTVGCHSHVVDADESNDQRNPFNLVTGDKMEICVCESGNLCNSSAVPIQASTIFCLFIVGLIINQ